MKKNTHHTVLITVVGEFDDELEFTIGSVDSEEIERLVTQADKLDLQCLNFIDSKQDTIFNEGQAIQIKKEIEIIKKSGFINTNLLDLIQHGAMLTCTDAHLFLKFENIKI